jgi:calcineurin-like phosphoesterase family protein
MKLFYVSDTHFNHRNIISYTNRPFASVDEMNEEMIRRWNEVVTDEDIVYHDGDFGFGKGLDSILDRLNGKAIYLIKGNHDRPMKLVNKIGFVDIFDALVVEDGDLFVGMSHYPMSEDIMKHPCDIYLYGHVHNNDAPVPWNHVNICVEKTDYRPVDLAWIKAKAKQQTIDMLVQPEVKW